MSFTTNQLEKFWDDTGGDNLSPEAKRYHASRILENLISKGYRIEFPELRYVVTEEIASEGYKYYIINDTKQGLECGSFTDRYFSNAKELAETFAENLNAR